MRRGRPNADNGILKKVDQPKWGWPIIGFERVRRTKSIHVLVSPLTIADATCKRAQSALCLALNLAQLAFRDLHSRPIVPVDDNALLREESLQCFQVLRRGKVARAVSHVVLESVGLLV